MFDYEEAAEELYEQIDDEEAVSLEEIEQDFQDYANMGVDRSESMRSIRSRYQNVVDMDDNGSGGQQGAVELTLDEISQEDQSVTVEVKVVTVYDDTHEAIRQKGRIGDATDVIDFVEFNGGEAPILEEGKSYRLGNVVTDEYRGNYSVKMLQSADVEDLDHDVEVTDNSSTMTAPIVNIQKGSGLIERCPEDDCTYVVTDRPCPNHGDVDGEDDLRIKAHLDTGQGVRTAIMDADIVKELTGMTIDEASELAREHMDRSVVVDEMSEQIVGRYFQFTGLDFDDLIVQDFKKIDADPAARVESLLQRAEEIEL